MPRTAGVYAVPPGTDAVSGATISSSAYNTFVHDVETDLNTPRPISAGGTGATDATTALANLGAAPVSGVTSCGQLIYSSSTQIKFIPLGGDQIKINGKFYTIPAAGIAGAPTGIYVNGTAGQNLVAGTTYYVYLFNNAGTPTFDFCTIIGHATSTTAGNVGTEIKSGDDSRTLVGMVSADAGPTFVDSPVKRFVISWFNRRPIQVSVRWGVDLVSSTAGTPTELYSGSRLWFLVWPDSIFLAGFYCIAFNSVAGAYTYTHLAISGGPVLTPTALSLLYVSGSASNAFPIHMSYPFSGLSEGAHYFTPFGMVSTGTGTWGNTGYAPVADGILFL